MDKINRITTFELIQEFTGSAKYLTNLGIHQSDLFRRHSATQAKRRIRSGDEQESTVTVSLTTGSSQLTA